MLSAEVNQNSHGPRRSGGSVLCSESRATLVTRVPQENHGEKKAGSWRRGLPYV